jgi:hypothetical protein
MSAGCAQYDSQPRMATLPTRSGRPCQPTAPAPPTRTPPTRAVAREPLPTSRFFRRFSP